MALTTKKLKNAEKTVNSLSSSSYTSPYSKQINSLTKSVLNPEAYEWDANTDTAYQSMKDEVLRTSQKNANDVAARANANSLGYGNTYGAAVAGQAYRQGVESLTSAAQNAEAQAYTNYQNRLQQDQNKLGILQSLDDSQYNRYQNALSNAMTNRDYYYNKAANDRTYNYQKEQDEYNKYLNELSLKKNSSVSNNDDGDIDKPKKKKTTESSGLTIPKGLESKLKSDLLTDYEKIQAVYSWGIADSALEDSIVAEYFGTGAVNDFKKLSAGPPTESFKKYFENKYGVSL